MRASSLDLAISDLEELFRGKYGDLAGVGWAPRLRHRFRYFTPDEHYEAVVAKMVRPGSRWLDVGCGRNIFPSNPALARRLAARCALVVGVDPDATLEENEVVHRRVRTGIEGFRSDEVFDVVTLRMVAEHITDPHAAVASLARLTRPGGRVVVYTINRWSPVPVITFFTPFVLHHPAKRLLWNSESKDTFPVAYRMNTRKTLTDLFARHGFREEAFAYLDDCRTLSNFRATQLGELCVWRVLRALGRRYPENCLLGIFERLTAGGGPNRELARLRPADLVQDRDAKA